MNWNRSALIGKWGKFGPSRDATFRIPPQLDLKIITPSERLKTPENSPLFRNRKIPCNYRAFWICVFPGDFIFRQSDSSAAFRPPSDFVTKIHTETQDPSRGKFRPDGAILKFAAVEGVPNLMRLSMRANPYFALILGRNGDPQSHSGAPPDAEITDYISPIRVRAMRMCGR